MSDWFARRRLVQSRTGTRIDSRFGKQSLKPSGYLTHIDFRRPSAILRPVFRLRLQTSGLGASLAESSWAVVIPSGSYFNFRGHGPAPSISSQSGLAPGSSMREVWPTRTQNPRAACKLSQRIAPFSSRSMLLIPAQVKVHGRLFDTFCTIANLFLTLS